MNQQKTNIEDVQSIEKQKTNIANINSTPSLEVVDDKDSLSDVSQKVVNSDSGLQEHLGSENNTNFLYAKSIPPISITPPSDFVVKDLSILSGLKKSLPINIYRILKLEKEDQPRFIRGASCVKSGLMSNKYDLKLFFNTSNSEDKVVSGKTSSLVKYKINQNILNNIFDTTKSTVSDIKISPSALEIVTNLSNVVFKVNISYLNYVLTNMPYLVDSGILPVMRSSNISKKSNDKQKLADFLEEQNLIFQDDKSQDIISQDDKNVEEKIDLNQGEKKINLDQLGEKSPNSTEHLKWISNQRSCGKNKDLYGFFASNPLFKKLQENKKSSFTSTGLLQGSRKTLKKAIYDNPNRALLTLQGISGTYNRNLKYAIAYKNLPIFFQVILDSRGRMYYSGDFGPLQSSFGRNLITFAQSCKVSSNSIEEYEFYVGLGKMIINQESNNDSFEFVKQFQTEILSSLDNFLWLIFKEPWYALSLILQLKEYLSKSEEQRTKGVSLFIKIPIDASASAFQIYSALSKNKDGAIHSNLIPHPTDPIDSNSVKIKDYYTNCLEICKKDFTSDKIASKFYSKCRNQDENGFIDSELFSTAEHIFTNYPKLVEFLKMTRSIFKPLLMRQSYGQGREKGAEFLLEELDLQIAQENLELEPKPTSNNKTTEKEKDLINNLNYLNKDSEILRSQNFKFFKITGHALMTQFSSRIEKKILFDKSPITQLNGFESLEDNFRSNLFSFINLASFKESVNDFHIKYIKSETDCKSFVINVKNGKEIE